MGNIVHILSYLSYTTTFTFIEDKIDLKLPFASDSWLYVSGDEKLRLVKETGLYDVEGDYVYGYKGIRGDRYSKYNFQYKYEKGRVYESHADFNNNNKNSFGLSVWTEEEAKKYCDEFVVKAKIHKDDLAALVHSRGKIRATKIEVLS